jgi:transposase InsO family protein
MREHHLQAPRRGGNAHGPRPTTARSRPRAGHDVGHRHDHHRHHRRGPGPRLRGGGSLHLRVRRAARRQGRQPVRGPGAAAAGRREHFGRFEAKAAEGLAIRHDHGSNYLSDDFQRELRFLGMASSPSFVREPEGNGCAERFIRTLKTDPTTTRTLHTRCRTGYNRRSDRLPLGSAGPGPLVPGSARFPRRILTMPRHPSAIAPPRL